MPGCFRCLFHEQQKSFTLVILFRSIVSGGSGGSPAERIPGAVYRPVKWVATTQMPQARARACAVATDDGDIYVLGKINCRVRDILEWDQ